MLLEKGEMQLVLLFLREIGWEVPREPGSFWDCFTVPESST